MSPIHVETADIPSYAASKVMTMITITGAAAEAVRSLVVLAEAEVVSEAEAVSVEAALAEEWAEAVVPVGEGCVPAPDAPDAPDAPPQWVLWFSPFRMEVSAPGRNVSSCGFGG